MIADAAATGVPYVFPSLREKLSREKCPPVKFMVAAK